MKTVRVYPLVQLVAVAVLFWGGCATGPAPRVDDGSSLSEARQASQRSQATSSGAAMPRPSPRQSMDRLIREMEGKPLLPSQEGSGSALQKTQDVPQAEVPVASLSEGDCPPVWWQRGDASRFLGGIGGPAESRESAEAQARLDIAKSIEVGISGTDTIQTRETSAKGFEYAVKSTIVERVNLSLTGFSIPNVGKCGNQWYARARLNRAEAENAWRSDLRGLDAEAETLRTFIGGKNKQHKDAFALLSAQYRLAVALETANQITKRLPRLTGKREPGLLRQGDVMTAKQNYESLVRSFRVELLMVKGNKQQAVFDRSLEDPLKVRLVAGLGGKDVPVPGVPVRFAFDRGEGEVDPPLDSTDHEGYARARVHRVEPAGNAADTEAVITARLHVADLDLGLPSSVHELFRKHADAQVLRFRIGTPFPCSSHNPFDSPLYALACDLVRKIDSSVGKPAIVRGFVERESREPHPLSARIEEALKAGLALTDQLHVLELPTSGNPSIAHDAEVEVSGVYELYRGNLLVKATLTRLTDHGLESASETTIPRAAVPRKDFLSLTSSTHALSLLPKYSDFATHDEWVEAFWHSHNPEQEFRTWIKPQQSVYQDNEHAVFFFKTERDCYLRVFTIDVSGTGAVLLPNTYRRDLRQTFVRANEGWVSIPGPADQFTLPTSPPYGGERIKTICTTRAMPLIPPDSIRALDGHSPMFVFSRDNQRFRDVGVGFALSAGEWSETHTTVSTIPKGRDATRGQRGLESRGF
ncbi:MAG: DUF4384 domain-containing protein [Nitrospira sp.]|nr:DUF4384 domain-containing protein [Nitrospira sp.]